MSGPSSLNVSTYTLRRPSTISNASFRRPNSKTGLVYMHKDSLLVPNAPYKHSYHGPVSPGSSNLHLNAPISPPTSSQISATPVTSVSQTSIAKSENYPPHAPAPQRRCSTSARLERQKSHRDEDNPPAFLELPTPGIEAEPGGDSLSPLPNRRMLFRRQGSQNHFVDSSNISIYEAPSFSAPIPTKKLPNQGQNSNDSETSLSKSFNILTPPTIVEIGCSNPDLTVIQNNAAPPQTSVFQPNSTSSKSALLSTNLLKPPDEASGKGNLSIPPRDVQETTLNIPAPQDRRNSSPHVMALSNLSLYSDDDCQKSVVKAKRLRDAFAKSQSQSRPEITVSNSELARQGSNIFSSSLKESRSSSSSKGLQDSHSSSSGLSTMTCAATVTTPIPPDFSYFATRKLEKQQQRCVVARHRGSKHSYHSLLRLRTRRTCSQSYCVCRNCIRYIESTFPNFSSDLYYVLVTRKLWPSFSIMANYNHVIAPLDIYSFMKRSGSYPHMVYKNSHNKVNRKILMLLADKIKTSL